MVSQKQRNKLIEAYKDEPLYVAGTLLKCGTCLLVLVGLVVVGTAGEPTDAPITQAWRSGDSPFIGASPHYLQEARVSSSRPEPALETPADPANTLGTQPVAFDRGCPGGCPSVSR